MGLREMWDSVMEQTSLRVWNSPLTPADDKEVCLDLPGYRQVCFYTCGYASALMVARARDPNLDKEQFYQLVSPTGEGTSDGQIMEALRTVGVPVKRRLDLNFKMITRCILDGYPIITSINRAPMPDEDLHWVVIYGFGWDPRRVFVAGNEVPGLGRMLRSHEMEWGIFRRIWNPRGDGIVCKI